MAKEKETTEETKAVKLVKMVRESEEEPKTADVHPEEVENYSAGGWVKAK